jgi:antitoxin component YwqK of YwqJK toxin-antitoxin module
MGLFNFLKKREQCIDVLSDNGLNLIYRKDRSLSERYYTKEGRREGIYEFFYLNGTVCESANYKNGKLEGLAKEWSSSAGCYRIIETYENDVLVNRKTYFTGRSKLIIDFENQLKELLDEENFQESDNEKGYIQNSIASRNKMK